MADDKTKTGPADRSKINMKEAYEVSYWTKELGVSKDKLAAAVKTAGVSVTAVKKELGKK